MERIDVTSLEQPLQGQMEMKLLFHGREACEPLHSWGPGIRDSYIMHYVHDGRGTFRIKGNSYSVSAGEGFLIPPDVVVHYEADAQDPWRYTWIGFRGFQTKTLLTLAGLDEDNPIMRTQDRTFFECLSDELVAASRLRSPALMFQSLLYRFFAELAECASTPVRTQASPSKEGYVRKAMEWIEHHYSQKIRVSDIADYVGLNRTYLSSLFQEQYGISLQHYLLQFRMNRAAALLRSPELSIGEVSHSVGYSDPFLFSKMFKKVTGLSPRALRSQISSQE